VEFVKSADRGRIARRAGVSDCESKSVRLQSDSCLGKAKGTRRNAKALAANCGGGSDRSLSKSDHLLSLFLIAGSSVNLRKAQWALGFLQLLPSKGAVIRQSLFVISSQ
jgi:hypothetical protein